jgi:hypothetical protein
MGLHDGTIRGEDMRRTIVTAGLVGTVLAAGLAAPAYAASPTDGCPSGYDRLAVAPLTDLGYQVPALVDSPDQRLSFGHQPGNGNGYVCGVPLGNQSFQGLQIYNFLDDSLQNG